MAAGVGHGRYSANFRRLSANIRMGRPPCALRLPGCEGIDYLAPKGHPRSFTVDHILPRELYPWLAEDPANLQAACWHCNASKGVGKMAKPGLGEQSEVW